MDEDVEMKKLNADLIALGIFYLVTQIGISLCCYFSYAEEICQSNSGIKVEEAIQTCSLGTGSTEEEAIQEAQEKGRYEFNKVCRFWDCLKHEILIKKEEVSCRKEASTYQCTKKAEFTIGKVTRIGAVAFKE